MAMNFPGQIGFVESPKFPHLSKRLLAAMERKERKKNREFIFAFLVIFCGCLTLFALMRQPRPCAVSLPGSPTGREN
jgi:hypothetical protein